MLDIIFLMRRVRRQTSHMLDNLLLEDGGNMRQENGMYILVE